MTTRWILVGGGHAHLHVLRQWARAPLPGIELLLISPYDHHHYSGMVPGFLRGTYPEEALTVDLRALARAAGGRFVRAFAEAVDGPGRLVEAAGERLAFDAVSLDVGSAPAGRRLPGVEAHALSVRPMTRAVALRARLDALLDQPSERPLSVIIVGGGAAGVEVALALERRIAEGGRARVVRVIERGATILREFAPAVRQRARRLLERRGIEVWTASEVSEVEADAVRIGGARVPSDLTVWLTGAAAPDLLDASRVPRDAAGFLHVDGTLRAVDGTPVWGAGDCVSIRGAEGLPKAGVYAVREAPLLDVNVRAALRGGAPRRYRPQRTFLSLMNTADGRAILRWHGLVLHARAAWWLKDRIDRRFMRRYQTP
ncbi:MAG TPA: FAD-dependent oxidoreductase [Vicinamibacterales bacterium]|nr:FAD-dependent oxidoreductase [Vicinamibacterales bacterium]